MEFLIRLLIENSIFHSVILEKVCTKIIIDITESTTEANEESVKKLKMEKELHLRRAEIFKNRLSENQKRTPGPTELLICLDF